MNSDYQFAIPKNTPINDLKFQLRELIPLAEDPPTVLRRNYYDTFDWRMYNDGGMIEEEVGDGPTTLTWRSLTNGELYDSLRTTQKPRFVWNFPPGAMRERLASVLEMRTLMPRATVESTLYKLRLLNKDDKTVLRIVLEDNQVSSTEDEEPKRIGGYVRLFPVKGYNKPLNRVRKLLEGNLGLVPANENLMLKALQIHGHQPGDYCSKLQLQLHPETAADAATRHILRYLLNTMRANEAGTLADLDSEFLHDFRVAIRRTRSALSQIKGVLPQEMLARFQRDFAWLGQITGPTRDLDVYLLKFDDYRSSLPAEIRDSLEPLRDFLFAHQKMEQRALAEALSSAHYHKLMKEWHAFLESTSLPSSRTPNADRPIGEVGGERIWRVYRRVLKEGRAIGPQSPAEDLHELRKTCKKLRYLMEFFQSLFPPSKIKILIKALKVLQENLGDFQDLEVQAQNLKRFSQQMLTEQNVPAETLMAMGVLVADLSKRQHQAREEFAARFTGFSLPENQALFKELFVDQREGVALAS